MKSYPQKRQESPLGSSGERDTRLDLGRAPVRWLADRAGVYLPLNWPDGAPARDPGQAGFWVSL